MKNTIQPQSEKEFADLLDAVCQHQECWDDLREAIWEAFNNQVMYANYTSLHWQSCLEAMRETDDDTAFERPRGHVEFRAEAKAGHHLN